MVKLFRKITMFVFILQNLTEKKCYYAEKDKFTFKVSR